MIYQFRGKTVGLFLFLLIGLSLGWGAGAGYYSWRAEVQAREFALITAQEAAKLAKRTANIINPEHLKCLATNIYHEASGEPFMGQVAVARVVMNRVKHGFASNPCKVVYQKTNVPDLDNPEGVKTVCQFSWVCEGKGMPGRNPNYLQAESIARQVLGENKWSEEVPSNILFFHNTAVSPGWNYKKTLVIGNHVFYSKK